MITMLMMTLFKAGEPDEPNQSSVNFEFSSLTKSQYATVNDGIMGGYSVSEFMVSPKGARFTGKVSLKNNGGFASVRMTWPFTNTAQHRMLVLKVKGDGKKYQFRLRTDKGMGGAAYSYTFDTIDHQVQTIYMPIESFVPTFRGRILKHVPELAVTDVQQMGVLAGDGQEGHFEVDLLEVTLQ